MLSKTEQSVPYFIFSCVGLELCVFFVVFVYHMCLAVSMWMKHILAAYHLWFYVIMLKWLQAA